MGKRKRIGLLLGEAEEQLQRLFTEGFLQQAFSFDYDVCVFAMYQKYQESVEREIGETNIFSLINYDLFDGFVVLVDTLQTPGLADMLEEKLHNVFSGPVIWVDKESKYFPVIKTNHYSSVKKIISHLIEVHGYKDIAYLTGKKWHIHSKERLQAYIDCMEEHGLPIQENRIFYGDYWYSSGETMVEQLLSSKGTMPRVIACANDCMAIGVAEALSNNGMRIPEDVAVVGYDSVEEGRTSPKPITSAYRPSKEIGIHAAISLQALFDNQPIPEFKADVNLFIGSSCGCNNESVVPTYPLRQSWQTDISGDTFFAFNNHMMDDILSQTVFKDLMNTIFAYVYQIGDFDSFHICLNSQWTNIEHMSNNEHQRENYTDYMLPILRCNQNDQGQNSINFKDTFDRKWMLPALFEEREKPVAFFFTPLHFEDRCLGYSAISYGNKVRAYDCVYRLWVKNVMQGLECFRRVAELQQSNAKLQSALVRDSLTGLYNFQGLLQQALSYVGTNIGVVVADIKGLAVINDRYGREKGNTTITDVATWFNLCFDEGICCRLSNGEFVGVIRVDENDKKELYPIKEKMEHYIQNQMDSEYEVSLYYGYAIGLPESVNAFERLVNEAVGDKNRVKVAGRKLQGKTSLSSEEQKEANIVQTLLQNNQFIYHFQPIVDAKTGEVYAYEALMRADVTPNISPLKILKYADYLEQLYEVERLTFFNVLDLIAKKQSLFLDKKVFLNSIPGVKLNDSDVLNIEQKLSNIESGVVVELTEYNEISDEELAERKKGYADRGMETAVDDYGTGYANVTNLLRYMPDYVKIDRLLLSKIHESSQKQHFVREIIEFANDNNIKTLAEGIETSEELQMVIHLGVDLIQGYYTGRPSATIVSSIDARIKNEILRYKKQEMFNKNRRVYVAGKEGRIMIAKLMADKYQRIEVTADKTTYRDYTITGIPGTDCDMILEIKDGYQGRIVLDNVSFSAKKNKVCIDIGESCQVIFVLKGENKLQDGGIRVPSSSKVILQGEGDLSISLSHDNTFGIGNNMGSGNGIIEFEQDGNIAIYNRGLRGVGIGSGKGGPISIKRGTYDIKLIGEEGIGIGAYYGDFDIDISQCYLALNISNSLNVGIGSVYGNVKVNITRTLVKGMFAGDNSIGIGTHEGKNTAITINNANIDFNMKAQKVCILGQSAEQSRVEFDTVGVVLKVEGKEAIAMGNFANCGEVVVCNSDIDCKIQTTLNSDMGAQESDILLEDSRCTFILNGKEIERHNKTSI